MKKTPKQPPVTILVSRAEYLEIKRTRPTELKDYRRILGSDGRTLQILSAAHHGIPMQVEIRKP